jgi:hypothetical protein
VPWREGGRKAADLAISVGIDVRGRGVGCHAVGTEGAVERGLEVDAKVDVEGCLPGRERGRRLTWRLALESTRRVEGKRGWHGEREGGRRRGRRGG